MPVPKYDLVGAIPHVDRSCRRSHKGNQPHNARCSAQIADQTFICLSRSLTDGIPDGIELPAPRTIRSFFFIERYHPHRRPGFNTSKTKDPETKPRHSSLGCCSFSRGPSLPSSFQPAAPSPRRQFSSWLPATWSFLRSGSLQWHSGLPTSERQDASRRDRPSLCGWVLEFIVDCRFFHLGQPPLGKLKLPAKIGV
jgi:hypothetical protein